MASATFDTLHAAKALTVAGFEAQQAEAITDTIREAFTESVATKVDIAEVKTEIAEVKSELKADIAEVRTEITEVKSELKADIAEVRTEIAEVKSELKAEIAEVRTEVAAVRTEMAERFEALYKQLWLLGLGIVTAVAAIVKLL